MTTYIPKITPQFKSFIVSLLKRTGISSSSIDLYTDHESMIEFRRAFTHNSYNSTFNNERLEFLGDGYVNLMAARYIRERFPKIISTHWLTFLHQNLTNNDGLYKLAIREGFINHLLYGEEMAVIVRSKNRIYNKDFLDMMEDAAEGLFGAISVITRKKAPRGICYTLSYLLYKDSNDRRTISLKYYDVFSMSSILKEVYDSGLHWEFDKNIFTVPVNKKSSYITSVYGYPLGDRLLKLENKKLISKKAGETEKISKDAACKDALHVLRKEYNIKEKIPPMYTRDIKNEEIETNSPPVITEEFKEFIKGLLIHSKVNKTTIDIITQEEYLLEFRLAFIHESYDPYYNSTLYHFVGIKTLDLVIEDYLFFNSKAGEKWLTIIKQNLLYKKKGKIFDFAEKEKFGDFIIYGPKVKENIDKFSDKSTNSKYREIVNIIFKSFMGVIMHVFDDVRGSGLGYAVAYNFFEFHMKDFSITEGANQKNRSRLKELYDPLRWDYPHCILYTNDPEATPEKGQHIITIKGYPKYDRKKDPRNEVILSTSRGKTKDEATEKAAGIALDILDRMYKIKGSPTDITKI
jgi:dsRNA-specific ribonuclease